MDSVHLISLFLAVMVRYVGLVVTLAALVLAFIVSSAKSYYDSVDNELTEVASDVAALDRVLSRYGPGTDSARQLLRQGVAAAARAVWANDAANPPVTGGGPGTVTMERLSDTIDALPAADARRAALRDQAIDFMAQIQHSGYKLNRIRQARAEAPLLVIIVSWLAIVFMGFGVVSPRTTTAITAMALAAVAAAGALFLVVELFSPVRGLIRIEPSVLMDALPAMGQP